MDQAVERAVAVMRSRYHERLSVAELAAEAFFSPFHFSRVFRRELGVSPVQYLTAVRLFEAKRLLQGTALNVADIACRVGYVGIGTFTTRFTSLVGVSPGHYRRLPPGRMLTIADQEWRLPSWDGLPDSRHPRTHAPGPHGHGGAVVGSAEPTTGCPPSRLFVGVFDETIPQGPPVAWDLVPAATQWRLDNLPAGYWTVMAVAEDDFRRPPGGNDFRWPAGADDLRRPAGGNDFRRPAGGADFRPPAGGDDFRRPARGNDSRRPAGGADFRRPAGGDNSRRPAGGNDSRRPVGLGGYGPACAIGTSGPVQVSPGAVTEVTLRMRQPQRTDPPILIPLCHCIPQPQSLAAM
jgi:AraC family transcriptional regulator